MVHKSDVVILGAGPSGIAAALSLGRHSVVLERETSIGGLARTIEINGAVFDIGGHSFHTPHPDVKNLVFDSLEMYEQKRDARCFAHGSIIPYPFQKNFRQLDNAKVVEECMRGLEQADGGAGAAHFEEYLERRFGAGIANHFMLPYNRKLWGRDLKRLSAEWVGARVAAPEGGKEKFELTGGQRKPLQSDTHVAYPAHGGFGEIMRALAGRVENLKLGTKIARIDPSRKEVITEEGEVYQWQKMISTLPIHSLLSLIDGVPDSLKELAGRLEYLSLKIVLVVIGHPVDTEIQRIYSSEPDIPAHKIAINHNSSDYLRSLPHHGIMAEISYSPEKIMPRHDLEKWFVESILKLGVIKDAGEVINTSILDVKYAYPVPTHERDAIMRQLKEWLAELDIYSLGRFGEWSYINSDEAMKRGLTLGQSLRNGHQ